MCVVCVNKKNVGEVGWQVSTWLCAMFSSQFRLDMSGRWLECLHCQTTESACPMGGCVQMLAQPTSLESSHTRKWCQWQEQPAWFGLHANVMDSALLTKYYLKMQYWNVWSQWNSVTLSTIINSFLTKQILPLLSLGIWTCHTMPGLSVFHFIRFQEMSWTETNIFIRWK